MPKILVSTPTYRSQVHTLYLMGVLSLARSTDIGFQFFGHTYLSVARNELTKRFLEAKSFDYLLFIDDDIGFQKSDLDTLLATGKDVVSGCYVRKGGESTIPACPIDNHWRTHPDETLFECSLLPAGFLLLSRKALENMHDAYGGKMWDADYSSHAEDYSFCRRYTAIGGQLWLETAVRLKHVGEQVFEVPD